MTTETATRDVVLSFLDFAVSYALPGAAGQIVTTVLPSIADMVFGPSDLEAYLGGGKTLEQEITLQDGTSFTVSVTQTKTPDVHRTLARAHADLKAGKQKTTKKQVYHSWNSRTGEEQDDSKAGVGGSFSLLGGGLIGVSW